MLHSLRSDFLLMLQFASFCKALAVPIGDNYDLTNRTAEDDWNTLLSRQSGKVALRIMPLGASITQGVGSTPENGYRKPLRDELRFLGHEVNMIGCQATGTFNDRQHEGHPTKLIGDMKGFASCSIRQKPNLVLIHVGTNDCTGATDDDAGRAYIADAENRLRDLVDYIFANSDGVTVILSTLLPNAKPLGNTYVDIVNQQIRRIVAGDTRKIQLAEMANNYIPLSQIPDGTHPNNDGFLKMAAVWAQAIGEVETKGWIRDPIDTGLEDGDSQCIDKPSPGNFRGPIQTQTGSGYEDGTYAHASTGMGTLTTNGGTFPYGFASQLKNYHFAQLVNINNLDRGGETDELIRVMDPYTQSDGTQEKGFIGYMLNDGGKYSGSLTMIDVKLTCINRGIRWADINGDGLDDFICLSYPAGDMYVALNRGGNPPTFEDIGLIRKSEPWATQDRIRLGDIDGDGRADWCAIDDVGDVYCWRNGGTGDAPIEKYGGYWQGMVGGAPTFNAKGMPGIEGVRFIDINGDFRADWVYVFPDGSTRIFINQRGTKADGAGLKPAWIEASVAHRGFPEDTANMNRDRVKFGRIYGSGRADYILLSETKKVTEPTSGTGGSTAWSYTFDAWRNDGAGGTKLRGDGVHYCDMYGRGYDDYLWVWSDGRIELFENSQDLPHWVVHNEILATGRARKSIHFGDWDGDGLCDVLSVDRHTGAVDMWKNTYKSGAVPTFSYIGQVTAGHCTQGWGTGLYDLGLRFADIDGDRRVDYLCMEPNGRTTGYLNTANGFVNQNQIKFAEGDGKYDRANHRFADVNGDGKADFLWIDKFTGNVRVWLNGGNTPAGGSSFFWDKQPDDIWMTGVDRGANIHFPKLGLLGRADYHQVLPKISQAYTYFNECPGGGSGGDDGPITDPNLPDPPPSTGVICPRADGACVKPTTEVIAAATAKYPKVDWVKTAETCDEPSFSSLVDTHGRAIDMMRLTPDLNGAYETTGFNRYFVSSTLWFENQYFNAQVDKYAATLDWAAGTPRADERRYKTSYYCKDPSWVAEKDKCKPGVGASTFKQPTDDPDCKYCMQVNICAAYWLAKPVDEITATKHYVEDLKYGFDNQLVITPREHVLIHEWFHNGITDSAPATLYHITDIEDTVGGETRTIYGAGVASRYAWEGFGDGPVVQGQIQQKVTENADSFAWMITYNWFEKAWGWTDDGRWKSGWAATKRDMSASGKETMMATPEALVEHPSVFKRLGSLVSRAMPRRTRGLT